VSSPDQTASPRKVELLEAAYRYVLQHGLAELSLRPLAAAIGSSPRVLLYLFDSKEGLTRALLARARADELAALDQLHDQGLPVTGEALWAWLSSPEHRSLLNLWLEAYARSLTEPHGPWASFAAQTVRDWLGVLDQTADITDRTLLLAVLRGALLDLLATGDLDRTTAAVHRHLRSYERDR
jgi:AcrR family transcriptional regulator